VLIDNEFPIVIGFSPGSSVLCPKADQIFRCLPESGRRCAADPMPALPSFEMDTPGRSFCPASLANCFLSEQLTARAMIAESTLVMGLCIPQAIRLTMSDSRCESGGVYGMSLPDLANGL